MWLMGQHTEPDEHVVATRETHSARDFLDAVVTVVNSSAK
jgi:GDP-D-mannose dehydratase